MKKAILNKEIQEFISLNLNSDISKLLLKGIPFNTIDQKTVIEQIEAKKRCQKKLPTWFNCDNIYYPNKLNIEQTSSEVTAKHKAILVSGKKLIDLTGGFGVDIYHFAKKLDSVIHCEINESLSQIVKHNFNVLNIKNAKCLNEDGTKVLEQLNENFDWIYLDPSRRDALKKKVFLLADCEPNIKEHRDLLFKYTNNVMIKTSPLLDLTATLNDLHNVKEIHVVANNNEVKELLWILEKNYSAQVKIITSNLKNNSTQSFNYIFNEEQRAIATYSKPLKYLYEPNSAVLKSGGFNSISTLLKIDKLHQHTHLYTSDVLMEFPGRQFKIVNIIPYNKKLFKKENISKANITIRNFPISVSEIRKKFNVKDGGNTYLFFTTDLLNKKIIILCSKVQSEYMK
ncbi:class I SAM-dependent methyltransferase [uncultured Winogradskyella sp.]|uniref:class I SAM-dependent methyltransferase n=1 Tax=Winogradskyella sp. 4-2091 TaxID=3381659 RepID=UPI0026034165|nr:class I SAM-dependent methyltransferase [uncultured Winogradskyella sp.]